MTVFAQAYSSQYDHLYATKDYRSECDLVEAAVKRYATKPPRTLLDIGCGTGSHSIELAQRGYQVTGVDLSQSMLDEAARKSSAIPIERWPVWQKGDARDFDTGRTFELGIMMFAVIGYLTTNDDVLKGLHNIRRQLEPGSLFVCDFWYGPTVLSVRPTDRVRVIETATGRVIRSASTTLDIVQHTAAVSFKLWTLQGDRLVGETNETHHLRYFFPQEFSLLLECAGFKLQAMSAFPSIDQPLGDGTWNALVVARAV